MRCSICDTILDTVQLDRYNNIKPLGNLEELALDAVKALNLSLGAVDIIWNEKNDEFFVLEVNTSPGLEGKTIDAYVKAIQEEYNL